MRQKSTLVLSFATFSLLLSQLPAYCGYDEFELPPGVEQTVIPKRLSPGTTIRKGPTPEDLQAIESYRAQIQRCFEAKDYADADPIYSKYIALLERVGSDDAHLASALQHYADLLRKINKLAEAGAAETRAQALLTKAEMAGLTYGLKEYRLGMSLDDFTRLPAPASADVNGVKSVCSCDTGQSVESVSEPDKAAKVIQCGYWHKNKSDLVGEPYDMSVANIKCSPDFRFVESEGIYRLYEISIGFYSSNFDDMKAALISKYGEPTKTEVEKVRTEMGNIFLLTNLIWDNNVSKIRLTNADGSNIGRARLRYIHRQLFLSYANRLKQQQNVPVQNAAGDL